jgi:hypothetical protein
MHVCVSIVRDTHRYVTDFLNLHSFYINRYERMSMRCDFFVLLVSALPTAMAIINAGTVLLKPCGVLEMEASWVDSPKAGS